MTCTLINMNTHTRIDMGYALRIGHSDTYTRAKASIRYPSVRKLPHFLLRIHENTFAIICR